MVCRTWFTVSTVIFVSVTGSVLASLKRKIVAVDIGKDGVKSQSKQKIVLVIIIMKINK